MNLKEATSFVCESIKSDPELYYAYQANIAMQFQDEFKRQDLHLEHYTNESEIIHDISNRAAKQFLDLWIKT